ncbi:hypothetical protein VTI74DRAFT_1231 [Chaetomium olivicolor]
METSPALGPGDSVVSPSQFQGPGNDTLVSEPAERGTPRAALVDALFSEDVARCRELLDAHPELVSAPLRHQAYNPRLGDSRALSPAGLAIIALLVERGAVLEISSRHSYWASHLLTEVCRDYDSPEALDLLVRIGADIFTRRLDDFNHTLLQVAAGRGAVGAVGFPLDGGVPMDHNSGQHDDGDGDRTIDGTPLHCAANNGRSQVVRLLLSRGALSDIETTDRHGRTPLLYAARNLFWEGENHVSPLPDLDREETVRLLVDAGADLTASDLKASDIFGERDPSPDSPLGHVTSWGGADIVRYLVSKGSDIHQQRSYLTDECFPYSVGGDNATPLHRAAYNWNAAAVQALLDLGADPGDTDEHGRQPLHWAAIGRCLERRSPRTISWAWNDLRTDPQRRPAFSERLAALESTISHLLAHNASVDQPDAFGRTPLHYAAYMKQAGAVTLLIQHGADPCRPDTDGRTTLHHLAEPLYTPHSRDLADATIEDAHLARTLAARLRPQDANNNNNILNRRDSTGATALHLAALFASAPAVALLLDLGADPNLLVLTLPDGDLESQEGGATALHLAARRPGWVSLGTYEEQEYTAWSRQAARIKGLLLDAGADAGARDRRGRTAGDIEQEVRAEIRRGREKYLEYLARPPGEYGRGRGFGVGWGRGLGRGGPHGSGSGSGSGSGPTTGNGRVDMAAGARHGRGSGERAA